ncbi:MAG TPA: hypothetical protein DCR58_09350 [Idiomarina baltica]|uniref:Uncharacterized protein n=1 Tax=Idiomarina baltica TaxID=190892 RepID=A0A348WR10_9GAMM|nr:hypothetical protein [Idiomarinaceae bacterium]HAE90894.1 hypothetical protein [Idiomarina sp.]HAR56972.1 hypothetical protein [Idiomarina baltica]
MTNQLWRTTLVHETSESEGFQKHVAGWQQESFLELSSPVRVKRARTYWRLFATELKSLTTVLSHKDMGSAK